MSHADDHAGTRRDFLYYATAGAGVVATGAAVWPLVNQMNPSADVQALASIFVDVSGVEVGTQLTVKWLGKPVFIRRRTPEEIQAARDTALTDLPDALVKNALSISGLYDLEPLRHTPFIQGSLRLTPADALKASPAFMPAPYVGEGRGVLVSVAGGDESDEFRRQNRLIRQAWGEEAVPVCEEVPGRNHFSVVDALVEPRHQLHKLVLQMLDI